MIKLLPTTVSVTNIKVISTGNISHKNKCRIKMDKKNIHWIADN